MTKQWRAYQIWTHPARASFLVGLKLLQWVAPFLLKSLNSQPFQITLFILNRCNLTCPYCGFFGEANLWGKEAAARLSASAISHMLDGLSRSSCEVMVTGGEPLLHAEVEAILETIARRGHKTLLFTNGLLLPKHGEAIAETCDRICLSIDGGEKRAHDRLRGSGSFEQVLSSVRAFFEGCSRRKPSLSIHYTLHPDNLESLYAFPALAAELLKREVPLDFVQFQHLFAAPRSWRKAQRALYQKWLDYTPETSTLPFYQHKPMDVSVLARAMKWLKEKMPVSFSFFPRLSEDELSSFYHTDQIPQRFRRTCLAAHTQLVVAPDGNVQICPDYVLGNINDQSMEEILASDRARKLKQVLASQVLFPFCKTCCHLYKL